MSIDSDRFSPLKLSHLDLDDRKFHKLVNICTVGNITVYVAKFEVYTQCSAASDCDFTNVVKGERLLDYDNMLVFVDNLTKRKLSWDFYALGDDLDPPTL